MQKIGLHIRLIQNLTNTIEKAIRLNLPFFQTFLILNNGKYIIPEALDIKNFLILRNKFFNSMYMHGSYWINLCNPEINAFRVLIKEINMAKKLEFSHIVLHPGAATGCKNKIEGITLLAKALNQIIKKEKNIKIILENTAHGGLSIGSDVTDFKQLLNFIDQPEQISFCIDTAHAYSYGYNIADLNEQENFINLLDDNIGCKNISLIHLNDTNETLGSKIDKHSIPGKGNIGASALKKFIQNNKLLNIPILTELPLIDENEEKQILDEINSWLQNK